MLLLRSFGPPLWTLFFFLSTLTSARQPPTSFCKCICFTNSTIIPLNSSPSSAANLLLAARAENDDTNNNESTTQQKRLTCSDCTRAFCLDYNLPVCKGAKEEDVFTTCFQRDSLKDETIVLLFIVMTTGLLGWAVLKPWVDRLRDSTGTGTMMRRYAPVTSQDQDDLSSTSNNNNNNSRSGWGRGRNNNPTEGLPAHTHRTQDSGGSESFARQGGLNS